MLITKEQFIDYPDLSPGKLTKLRAANVDNEKLARVAIKYNLHNYLRHKKPLLKGQVSKLQLTQFICTFFIYFYITKFEKKKNIVYEFTFY